jgi:hypothetical protein
VAITRAADSAITNGTKYNTMSAGNYSANYINFINLPITTTTTSSAVDGAQANYLTGKYNSTTIFVNKYDKFGVLVWQKFLTNTTSTSGSNVQIAVSSDGSAIYISNEIVITSPTSDICVIKLDSNGTIQWQYRYDLSGAYDEGSSVSVASNGNVFIYGNTTAGGYKPIRIVLNSSGSIIEQHTYSEGNINFANDSFLDGSNRLYSTTTNSVDGSIYDIVLLRFDAVPGTGTQWARKVAIGENMATGRSGISGTSSGDIYFVAYPTGGTRYGLLFKYNSSGTAQWIRKTSTSFSLAPQGVALDSSGNCYVGFFGNNLSFIVKYNSSGEVQWQKELKNSNGAITIAKLRVIDSNNLQVVASANSGTNSNSILLSIPTDGSKNFVRAVGPSMITCSDSNLTDQVGTATQTSPSFTLATPSYTATSINHFSVSDASWNQFVTRLP